MCMRCLTDVQRCIGTDEGSVAAYSVTSSRRLASATPRPLVCRYSL